MEEQFVKIFSLINKLGIDNGMWGFISDTDTQTQFGVGKDIKFVPLKGTWLYLYIPFNEIGNTDMKAFKELHPTLEFKVEYTQSYILLYNTKE